MRAPLSARRGQRGVRAGRAVPRRTPLPTLCAPLPSSSRLRLCSYSVSFCAEGKACELLDERLTVSACPVRAGKACGGRGRCDERTGACACDPGFEGPACARGCGAMAELACGCGLVGGLWDGMPRLLTGQGGGADALHSLRLLAPTRLTLSTCGAGTDVDTVLAVYRGCPLGADGPEPTPLGRADDEGCGAAANLSHAAAGLPPGASGGASYGMLRGSVLSLQLPAGEYVVAVSGCAQHRAGPPNGQAEVAAALC